MSVDSCADKWSPAIAGTMRRIWPALPSQSRSAAVAFGLLLISFSSGSLLSGQQNPQDANAPADDLQRLPSDRKIAQQLQELTRLARGGNLVKIRDTLQLLRGADPSLMVPDRSKVFRPLHRDLIDRIQAFSPQLQSELLKDAGATPQSLQIAFEDGGPAGLLAFLHRYAGTAESLKAHLLLAAIHRDRGHRQAALYWLAPVLHASAPRDLRAVAISWSDELNQGFRLGTVSESGSDHESDQDPDEQEDSEESIQPVADPPILKGPAAEANPAQPGNAGAPPAIAAEEGLPDKPTRSDTESALGFLPHAPAWQQKLYLSSAQRRASQDLVRLLANVHDQRAIAWTVSEPVVDAEAIYVRSSGGLLAYDRLSGKVLWTRLLDRQPGSYQMPGRRMGFPDGDDRSAMGIDQLQNSREVLELHRDEITTRMTADSSRLFVISDTGESAGSAAELSEPFRMFQGRSDLAPHSLRELVAVEKATGRRLWSAGGVAMEERFGNELSRAWFAGPPTVSGAVLYCVVEQDDAHWLVCLKSETGEVLWRVMLAYPETNINQDPYRQLLSSRPVVADGMIWTNTSDGWLVAIDELTRRVVWSRNMIRKPADAPRIRNMRNVVLQAQPLRPFQESWRPESMQLLPDSLLVTGTKNHQLLLINPLTGSVRRWISAANATVILDTSEESIVTAGPGNIQRWDLKNLDAIWTTQLPAGNVAPTGPGARLGDQLLIPLSDGSVQCVRYSDGQLSDNLPGLRPAYSAGGLTSIQGDVISYGVDHVSLYSQSATAGPSEPDPLEQARFLIETARFADAEQILINHAPTTEQADAVQRLLFRTSAVLAIQDASQRNKHLENAARYAASTEDKAVVQFLTLATHPDLSADQAVEFLKASPSVLNTELPDFEDLQTRLLSPVLDLPVHAKNSGPGLPSAAFRPLRHVLLQHFEQKLTDSAGPTSAAWLQALRQISDVDLLSLNLPGTVLREELLNRAESAIEAGRMTESTLHLLLQAQHCTAEIGNHELVDPTAQPAIDPSAARQHSLVDRFEKGLTAEAARVEAPLRPHPAALNLLTVLRMESLPAAATASEAPSPHEILAQQWTSWKDLTYTLVPVNPVAASTIPQNNERTLSPRSIHDRFLSGWRWSTIREPSVLAVRSLLQPEQPLCTIDGGMFDALSFGDNGTVARYGSVALVQNSMGLSAVSLIDQTVLWSRQISNQSSSVLWHMLSEMHLFSTFHTSLPAWQAVFGRELRICGGNERWICLQSPSRIEVIDLLTGQNLWSRQIDSASQIAFATDSSVFLTSPRAGRDFPGRDGDSAICLNRTDGSLRETKISQTHLQRTILATGDELVIWNQPRSNKDSPSLSWVKAETGEERHNVKLTDMENCHFLDVRTLVSITTNASFEVIDLVTADRQVVHLNADAAPGEPSNGGAIPEQTNKYIVVADPANYYVFPFPDRQAVQLQVMLGSSGDLNLYPVHQELRAIDRASGKLRWVWKADENTAAWFDPTADPVLLLVTNSVRKNKANGPPMIAIPGLVLPTDRRTTITGLSRMSGTKLFDYHVSSRFPVPSLQFKITPQHYLDLQAFGNRVRFIPESNAQPDGKPHAVD